jgi:hypothetical protein
MSRGPSAAKILARLAQLATLNHTADGKTYAHIPVHVDGQTHEECWPVRSRPFKGWLRRAFYLAQGKPAPAQAMAETIDLIEAQAFEAKRIDVHVRVAEHEGAVYLDLCDTSWRAVKITPQGWGSSPDLRSHSGGRLGCWRCLSRRPAGASMVCASSSTSRMIKSGACSCIGS